MRGRVRNNYFSVRVDMAQKATFARDAARDRACIYVPLESKKKYTPLHTHVHGNRVRQWLPVPSLRGVQLSVWTTIA